MNTKTCVRNLAMAISLAWAASATGAPAQAVPGDTAIKAAKHAVTAYRDIHEQARKAGCADVLYKPIDQPALADMLSRHLDGH